MPTVFKKGEIAIKNRTTGEYDKYVNVVAEQTTEDMIENIQQEGATQIAAVEAKGEEFLGSTPDADGTYVLNCTVSNGVASYSWVLVT